MKTQKSRSPEPRPSDFRRMPAVFVGHGSPMNAIEDNEFSRAWIEAGLSLPRPKAILAISAHWETEGTKALAVLRPETIHDFYGFPEELYEQHYPASGFPQLAALVRDMVGRKVVELTDEWGLDHGAWIVLKRLFPQANIPVTQLSLDRTKGPEYHYRLGQKLKPLREQGVLILGSGNIVHNLALVRGKGEVYPWAAEFDENARELIIAGNDKSLIDYERLEKTARLAVPTNEHYLPLLYVLGCRDKSEEPTFFAEGITLGSISMRSVRFG